MGQPTYWKDEIKTFQQYLPNGHILKIGSGGGTEGSAFTKMGYSYTGIDASSGLISAAKTRFPKIKFINKNVYEINFAEQSFDGFWCAATLLHIPQR